MKQMASTPVRHTRRRIPSGFAGPAACAVALGCLTAPNSLRAVDSTSPDAAAILDKYVEVTGGKAAHERIYNRVKKGHHEFVEMGLKGTQIDYVAKPNKSFSQLELEALGKVEQGTDGEVAWYPSSATGPLVESGDALAAALDKAAFDRVVQWRKYYKKAECVGEEVVDGKTCYKIVMTPNVGKPETHYYEKQSNLLIKAKKTRLSSHMPPMSVEVTVSDYRWVDGLLLAHKRKQVSEQCGSPREILFVTDSIGHNVELPADRFDPPEEVRALVRKEVSPRDTKQAQRAPCGSGKKVTARESAKQPQRAPCGGGS